MANKRIVDFHIVESDRFCDMKTSSQLLYFHLLMNADNEGFVSNLTSLTRSLSLSRQSLDELTQNGFVIVFKKEKVALVTHWLIHNPSNFFYSAELNYPLLAESVYVARDATYTLEKCYGIVTLPDFKVMRKRLGSPAIKRALAILEPLGADKISEQIRRDSDKKVEKDADGDICVESEKKLASRCSFADDGSPALVFTAVREGRHAVVSALIREATEEEIAFTDREPDESEYVLYGTEQCKNVRLTGRQASSLYGTLGVQNFRAYVEKLSDFILEKGANVKNHYALILKWAREDGVIDA